MKALTNEQLRAYIESRIILDSNECWIWQRSKCSKGYGDFRHLRQHFYAHRSAYEAFIGPIPEGLHVLHHCDNASCCNPNHLFLGTNQDNIADSVNKGRRKGVTRNRPSGLHYNWTKKPGPPRKLTDIQIEEMRNKYATGLYSKSELARQYGLSSGVVCRKRRGYLSDL